MIKEKSILEEKFGNNVLVNENLAKYLTSKSFWGGTENFTYQLVYYLLLPFEDYRIKFFK